jgi:hypothetical protein
VSSVTLSALAVRGPTWRACLSHACAAATPRLLWKDRERITIDLDEDENGAHRPFGIARLPVRGGFAELED